MGEWDNPCAAIPAAQAEEWAAILHSQKGTEQEAETRTTWRSKLIEVVTKPPERRWKNCAGPIEATITTILDLGWIPSLPNLWYTKEDKTATLDTAQNCEGHGLRSLEVPMLPKQPGTNVHIGAGRGASAQVTTAIKQRCMEQQWEQAVKHTQSEGLGNRPSLKEAKKAWKTLWSKGKYNDSNALGYIVVGALNDIRLDDEPKQQHYCHRCGFCKLATRRHVYWECPDNASIQCSYVKDTETLAGKACLEWCTKTCMWAKATKPTKDNPEAQNLSDIAVKAWKTKNFDDIVQMATQGFIDGAWVAKEIRSAWPE